MNETITTPEAEMSMPAYPASVTICGAEFTDPKIIALHMETLAAEAARVADSASATGTIRPYDDALGRRQTAVDGPNGTYLVTRDNDFAPYLVWKSDEAHRAVYRGKDAALALEKACKAAGVEI